VIWAGLSDGKVHVTVDDGRTWLDMTDKLTALGAYGRAFWITDVSALQQLNGEVLAEDVYLSDVEPTVQGVTWEFGANDYLFGQAQIQTPNPDNGMVVRYYLKDDLSDSVNVLITTASGEEVARLEGKTEAGLHSVLWTTRSGRGMGVGGFQGSAEGPVIDRLAPLGDYTVTLEAGERRLTKTGSIVMTQGWSIGPSPQAIR
jgi:hypothetical protein